MSQLIFSHANGFGFSTYRKMFAHLERLGYQVNGVERLGHDVRYPVTDNWPHTVIELADFIRPLVEKNGEACWLAGHSLGGYLSLMLAAHYPELAKGVILIDSPLVSGWRSSALMMMKVLPESMSRGYASSKRRAAWPSAEAAFVHFRHRKTYANWDEEVLWDYIHSGTEVTENGIELSFSTEIEATFYNTLPHNTDSMLLRYPLKCPVSFIGGLNSVELQQTGTLMTEKVTAGRMMMINGTHLFPMENPLATAAAIDASILNMIPLATQQSSAPNSNSSIGTAA